MEENKCYDKGGQYNLFDVDEKVSTVFDDKLKEKKKEKKRKEKIEMVRGL